MGNIVKVTAGGPDIEANVYPGRFVGAEIWDPKDEKTGESTSLYGPSRRWKFEALDDGEFVPVERLTGLSIGPKAAGGRILAGILGRQPEMDEEIDLDDLKGATVQLVVAPKANGWMHVESVLPAKKAR